MIINDIDISSLLKALKKFESFRLNINTDQEKAGAIQAFEYCYELLWKNMKRFLGQNGIIVNSPKETFRAAALEGLIDDPEIWFDFIKKRNITVHTYQETEADDVIKILPIFSNEAKKFLKRIGVNETFYG